MIAATHVGWDVSLTLGGQQYLQLSLQVIGRRVDDREGACLAHGIREAKPESGRGQRLYEFVEDRVVLGTSDDVDVGNIALGDSHSSEEGQSEDHQRPPLILPHPLFH